MLIVAVWINIVDLFGLNDDIFQQQVVDIDVNVFVVEVVVVVVMDDINENVLYDEHVHCSMYDA